MHKTDSGYRCATTAISVPADAGETRSTHRTLPPLPVSNLWKLCLALLICVAQSSLPANAFAQRNDRRRPDSSPRPGPNPGSGGGHNGSNEEVNIERELMITDLGVVENGIFTDPTFGPFAVWSFKYLIEQMAGEQDPSEFAMTLMTFGEQRIINGYNVPARNLFNERVLQPWLERSGGETLDLTQAPVKLLAIVNRIDLREIEDGNVLNAGEGRFIFGVVDDQGKPLTPLAGDGVGGMTIIFEYELPASSQNELERWANDWHALGRMTPGTWNYNLKLAQLTKRFTDRGRGGDKPNGSALNQIRTNEISLSTPWELREWVIDADTGLLKEQSVAETPDFFSFNNTPELEALLSDNAQSILDGTFSVPEELEGGVAPTGPFPDLRPDLPQNILDANLAAAEVNVELGTMDAEHLNQLQLFFATAPQTATPLGSGLTADIPWQTPNPIDPEVRHLFAVNTCSGCHRGETGTGFLHVAFPEEARDRNVLADGMGAQAILSEFLTGGAPIPDPVAEGVTHEFNDLERHKLDLEELLQSGPEHSHRSRRVH